MSLIARCRSRLLPVVSALFLSVCGGDKSPSGATPAPTPTPAPAPTPTPAPTPVPASAACAGLPKASGSGSCSREAPSFLNQVDAAINALQREQADIFSGDHVKSIGRYYVGLIDKLAEQGLCADFDGEELQVTNTGRFSDQYHVLTSGLIVRRGDSSYRATCSPAVLPTPAPPLPQTPGCSLPPSKEKACGREEQSRYLGVVDAAINQAVREHPEFFNLGDTQRGTDWYRVVNSAAYFSTVVANVSKDGRCAMFDGEELVVKGDDQFSEHFDIYTADGYIRRGEGSYRSSCYPAAF
jgi:hypothetical protein